MRGKGGATADPELRLDEARGLALAIGIEVAEAFTLPLRSMRPGTLFGEGQIQRIADVCNIENAELFIVDGALSAVQQRNLEEKLGRKVIDRTGLILEIFGERAATAEGRLQVELAHLDYQAGRLVRSWTHLERQRGGFGFLGGPGETQIEADRRMIRNRMARIRRELEQVRRTRGLHRDRRQRAPWPVIALVGYTNAGKSTLVRDVANPASAGQKAEVEAVLADLGVTEEPGGESQVPLIEAWNKWDLLAPDERAMRLDLVKVQPASRPAVPISAITGEGIEPLFAAISAALTGEARRHEFTLSAGDGQRLAWLYANGEVLADEAADAAEDGPTRKLSVRLTARDFGRYARL
ncbi:MAG: GTPase HflX [Novosphingobium sp.]|nr:GTPase HflX [Novosphingobium sp.]